MNKKIFIKADKNRNDCDKIRDYLLSLGGKLPYWNGPFIRNDDYYYFIDDDGSIEGNNNLKVMKKREYTELTIEELDNILNITPSSNKNNEIEMFEMILNKIRCNE